MYDDYLTCQETYIALENLFLDEFRSFASKNIQSKNFLTPFYATTFNNGQRFADANPIFSVRDLKGNRVMRIVISEDEKELSIFFKPTDFGDETVVFGGIINLEQMLQAMREWAVQAIQ